MLHAERAPQAPEGTLLAALATGALLAAPACARPVELQRTSTDPPADVASSRPVPASLDEPIFDGGLKGRWQDWGWAPRDDRPGGPARLRLSDWHGWILANPTLEGAHGTLVFRYRAPGEREDFFEVHVESADKKDFPRVRVTGEYRSPLPDGWVEAHVPLEHLNPAGLRFDRIVLFVTRKVGPDWIEVDKVGFSAAQSRSPIRAHRRATLTVDCGAGATRISPLIYGIAYGDAPGVLQMRPTIRRWGGNPTSRYNWELGNAWNTGKDWYWENAASGDKPGAAYRRFLDDDLARGMKSALTVPMLGWVAKDTTSYSFPVSAFGAQDSVDPSRTDIGNGMQGNKPLGPPPPTRTSVPAPPAFIQRWIEAIRAEDRRTGVRSVHQYILDNEPNLWNSTHRDVHPEPLSYDELLQRTVAYASAIRAADPEAVIAGPAEWGWLGYQDSAKDGAAPFGLHPDRSAHGGVPLVPWYLERLREHEHRTGVRLLDVLDLHFYPQGKGVYGDDASSGVAALRIRSTRALWDPGYVDESWIAERIMLIPRMKQWIEESYPGRGISIGEWSFGGERHMSGGLATAEALGRFGQGGVTSAFYWMYPPADSPAYWAFRAYRDFDGRGGHFLDWSVPARASEGTSIFASRDEAGRHLVAVVLNFSPDTAADASVKLLACGAVGKVEALSYAQGSAGFAPIEARVAAGELTGELSPYSINVIAVELSDGG